MLKMTGAVLIGVVCVYFGFVSADNLKKRKEFLTAFITSLSILESEICFAKYDLKFVFGKLTDKRLFDFYTACCEELEKHGIKSAWDRSVLRVRDKASLKREDAEAVMSLGAELGMSDVEGQKKAIKRTLQMASGCARSAEDEYERLGRVYRNCGVLAGVFVFIMFL